MHPAPPKKDTGLFFDLYSPLSRLRAFDRRLGLTQLDAAIFAQDVTEGRPGHFEKRSWSEMVNASSKGMWGLMGCFLRGG